MHYLTSLVLIETSRARGAAIDAELRRAATRLSAGAGSVSPSFKTRKENKMKSPSNRWLLAALTLLIAARADVGQ
jgi:hypothetical protein